MVFFFGKKEEVTVVDEEKAPIVQVVEKKVAYGSSMPNGSSSVPTGDESSLENLSVSFTPSLPSHGSGEGLTNSHLLKVRHVIRSLQSLLQKLVLNVAALVVVCFRLTYDLSFV